AMSTLPQTEPWFRTVFAFVKKRHDGKTDELGRPYYQHFERVANRLVMRFPGASPAQVQAALLHDAFEPGGTEPAALRANGASDEAIRIIERITLPTDG